MSRSGYSDDCENLELYRQAVERALKGRRGQAFLKEMAAAMDAMTEKILIADELVDSSGNVCALGSVCKVRNLNASELDYLDPWTLSKSLGIAGAMVAEIEYMNDEAMPLAERPAERWVRMRAWIASQIIEAKP